MESFLNALEDVFELKLAEARAVEVRELAEAARVGIQMCDLLRRQQGKEVQVELESGQKLLGIARAVNVSWVEIWNRSGTWVVAVEKIVSLSSTGRAHPKAGELEKLRKIGSVMRQIAREGRIVLLTGVNGREWRGRITGVGADYLQLDGKEALRMGHIESVRSV